MIQKFTVSRDDSIYEAWPDLTLAKSGKLVCVFSECTHHNDRSYTRIMLAESNDRGRSWMPKRALSDGTKDEDYYYNCARISTLKDGRLVVLVDKLCATVKDENCQSEDDQKIILYFSEDQGDSWSDAIELPMRGIVPDKLLELDNGRWIIACQYKDPDSGFLVQRLWYSDDQGKNWSAPLIVGKQNGLHLCEASILHIEGDTLVCFMRENSLDGKDCYKSISHDNGENWSELIRFPLPGCHRPVSGWLNNDMIMITYRFLQGGKGEMGSWTQNFFAALTDKKSVLATQRNEACVRIIPIDYDRSPKSDLGYSGWVQFEDNELYIVNYIVDDAPNAQIRGYSLSLCNFIVT